MILSMDISKDKVYKLQVMGNIKVNGTKDRSKAKVKSHTKTGIHMRVNGLLIVLMVKVLTLNKSL